MIRKFHFDYDLENDSLFLYDPKSKSKASVTMEDLIIDFNNRQEVSGVELLNASAFLKDLAVEGESFQKEMLTQIQDCRVEIIPKNNFILLKFFLMLKSKKQLTTPILVPTLREHSPAVC